MFQAFFSLAMLSPGRQQSFRGTVVVHLGILAGGIWALLQGGSEGGILLLGYVLLTAGIVEGAILVGWRLTQLPKSQALEFLLVTPLRPRRVLLAEALVGLARLALVTLAGGPVLVLLIAAGYLELIDLGPLLLMPFTWGAITGLGFTVWAYEPVHLRRWAERGMLALVVLYLAVGVLAGEHLRRWVEWLPEDLGWLFLTGFEAIHRYSPFAVLRAWLLAISPVSWDQLLAVQVGAVLAVGLLLLRAAARLQGHFQDRHYGPAAEGRKDLRHPIGDQPLSWWAVRRVTEYAGRVNLWLAGGFGALYALYTIAGPHWPGWLGRKVFLIFDQAGGIPVWAAALVVLAAVPAAFQYGLWDSNTQDRCRRLELLLLTRLNAIDYWQAAAAAAWRRGRGYFGMAVLLWAAALYAGQIGPLHLLAALTAGVGLWGLYFALGFRAFSRGVQANGLGLLLTLGLPLLAHLLYRAGWPAVGALVPPGSVYALGSEFPTPVWLLGPLLSAVAALAVTRLALVQCDRELRLWYDQHQGHKFLD
jgi:hypothetical protein